MAESVTRPLASSDALAGRLLSVTPLLSSELVRFPTCGPWEVLLVSFVRGSAAIVGSAREIAESSRPSDSWGVGGEIVGARHVVAELTARGLELLQGAIVGSRREALKVRQILAAARLVCFAHSIA
jgi:hypothetical protein